MASLHDSDIDYREHPEKYKIGTGEKGVLTVEPYKSEILPHWRFKTPEITKKSAEKIISLFQEYIEKEDFVGADMARKFLRMGMTRAKRYARHSSGQKYDENGEEREENPDAEKLKSFEIFKEYWKKAKNDERYKKLKEQHRAQYY